jgi:hypothetical protein
MAEVSLLIDSDQYAQFACSSLLLCGWLNKGDQKFVLVTRPTYVYVCLRMPMYICVCMYVDPQGFEHSASSSEWVLLLLWISRSLHHLFLASKTRCRHLLCMYRKERGTTLRNKDSLVLNPLIGRGEDCYANQGCQMV